METTSSGTRIMKCNGRDFPLRAHPHFDFVDSRMIIDVVNAEPKAMLTSPFENLNWFQNARVKLAPS
jgi:hypothetical protein